MKHLILFTIVVLLLSAYSIQTSKAFAVVTYFGNSGSTLDNVMTVRPKTIGISTILVPGTPVVSENIIYLPVSNYGKIGKKFYISSAIYAYDTQSKAIVDSLILDIPKISISATKIVMDKYIYIVGIKDTMCVIYQTDKHLKVISEFATSISAENVVYADVFGKNLRVVTTNNKQVAELNALNMTTMLSERKVTLAKNGYLNAMDKQNLYFFTAQDSTITCVKCDMTKPDADLMSYILKVKVPKDNTGNRTFRCSVTNGIAYISYSGFDYPDGLGATLAAVNIADGSIKSTIEKGSFACDVLSINGKTYIFRTQPYKDTTALKVAELTPDLQELNPQVDFLFSNNNFIGFILPYKEGKVILTGSFRVENVIAPSMDLKDTGGDDIISDSPSIFMGILNLKQGVILGQ